MVRKPNTLQQVANILYQEPIVAVDTEANSLYAYQEQVCLIQFSTRDKDYLVDPLAINDLSPLASLFASHKTEKIFHAAEYDLIVLDRDFGFEFNNLFDTMLAARILGWKKVGLASILQSHFGIKPNKRYQRANWGKRPLPDEMLTYAQLDTHFLIPLREKLYQELMEVDRWDLAEEDFQR
ncbi:MAG: ribonuclease D, partial [candidate division Zixibacteria bacterium]|nr:ribonuclease D [candidate division Zixibacteria bacterium]NIX80444.1 ribonuclease D [candidate division Zixibacteria bacterium]